MHATFVTVHAAAATTSLVAAVVLLLPRRLPDRTARSVAGVLVGSTAVMALSLAGAVVVAWDDRPAAARAVFTALAVLAAAAAVLAVRAAGAAPPRTPEQVARLYGAGGFVLITQVTGFSAVAVLDVLPTAGVVAVAVATVLAARTAVGRLRAAAGATAAAGGAG
ncbi:hypothetical protein [Quadrisphaera sp. KR29]|uniref:hypothetical protein n=1 Tax=Quadrisphaera sp. KR29 TaxID=3461391 RepID=UPI004043FF6D